MAIITIFGATGAQGTSVLDAVLADGTFTPRAVTRNPDSDASKALKAKGVEVVKANLNDKESIKAALKGSDVVFGVTNFWDPEVFPADPTGKAEVAQGKNLVDAAKEVGIKFFVWSNFEPRSSPPSTLPNATKISGGKYSKVYHYDNKAIIEEYLKASGTAWFGENLWNLGSLQKTDDGYTIPTPKFTAESHQLVTWSRREIGTAVLVLAKNYSDASKGVLGKTYPVVMARVTYPELAKAISQALGVKVSFSPIPTAGLAEIDDMFAVQADYDQYPGLTIPNKELVTLGAKMGTLDEFINTEVVPRFKA
ncbi:hypothetical protein C8J57DRAFT_1226949 [Mycena rebaudengoi]|nr:hypothetical protein C8J57DRAFT_1226949 [Mycena rebaudengoi]